ncbi:hypothetical protein HDU91_003260 [Kappamyces sp. JEL0680]|nr:hypothetical protein HDU91_003260 [Kappamyces sp. JEL0680]
MSKDSRNRFIVTLEGLARARLEDLVQNGRYYTALVTVVPEPVFDEADVELQATVQTFRQGGIELVESLKKLQLPPTILKQLNGMLDSTKPGQLADLIASMIDLSYQEKLEVLELHELQPRLLRVLELITRQLQVFAISQKLSSSVENKLGAKQREILLREQLEAIKKELGESDDGEDTEIGDLAKRLKELDLPEEHKKVANREMTRLKRMNPNMSEHQVIRSYLEWIIDLPWSKSSTDRLDIAHARKVLNDDHHGLDKIKSRIIEYLSIKKLKKDMRGPILCFLGPPGVGKTSLGKSIANALGRKFYRISLGGVRDEAEIRGHRRTYIGSMPGLIIQAIKRCGVNNPVILLDEIDKLGQGQRGDPSAALLEVLDPEQNSTFSDHYMNLPFDLSKVLFIATANEYDTIPAPLMDRMVSVAVSERQELIRLSGYTIDEKMEIGRRFLLPKQIAAHGLPSEVVTIPDAVLEKLVIGYTREAGVRNLEREIGALCRTLAVEYSDAIDAKREKDFQGTITAQRLEDIIGAPTFEDEVAERTGIPGVVTGLAWTSTGSGGLLFIEASASPGKGQLVLTGKLGDVIKESARIALSWVRSNLSKLNHSVSLPYFDVHDIHIHFPAGSTPKDGPSAGVAITTALVSMLVAKPISPSTAMTGEMTLRGQVLPVGGIKEKLLAAHRGGIKRVLIPDRNRKDVADVPLKVRQEIDIVYCKTIWQVLEIGGFVDKSNIEARL